MKTDILLKRVYEDYDKSDGFRVLVDRLWPRGMKKEHLKYDLWAKDITPSPDLRKFFHEDPDKNWDLFVSKYTEELENSPQAEQFVELIKKYPVVTLLYAAKSKDHNHALVLRRFLLSKLNEEA